MAHFKRKTTLGLLVFLMLAVVAFAADQRIQYTEEMVGANHPTKSDTLNRLSLVEHSNDGTHGAVTATSLSLGTGELTAGSINRASGTLTLEIGGTAELSISSTTSTFGGNLVIPNSGTIGSVGTPGAMTILSSGNVGVGTASPLSELHVLASGTSTTYSGSTRGVLVTDATGPRFIFEDSGETADDKIMLMQYIGQDLKFSSMNDAGSAWNVENIMVLERDGNIGIGTTSPNQLLTVENSMSLKEIADANADTAAYGQIWVHDTTPNELWFTDDAGTDTQISSHPMDAPSELYTNGPGLDWMGVKRHKLLGIIQWQTLDGEITEETFEAYNARRKDVPGHKDLVKIDYNEWVSRQKAIWAEANMTEVETTVEGALESYEEDENITSDELKPIVRSVDTVTETKYRFDVATGEVKPEQTVKEIPVYETRKVTRYRLRSGFRIDEETGKCYHLVAPPDADFDDGLPKWMKDRIAK